MSIASPNAIPFLQFKLVVHFAWRKVDPSKVPILVPDNLAYEWSGGNQGPVKETISSSTLTQALKDLPEATMELVRLLIRIIMESKEGAWGDKVVGFSIDEFPSLAAACGGDWQFKSWRRELWHPEFPLLQIRNERLELCLPPQAVVDVELYIDNLKATANSPQFGRKELEIALLLTQRNYGSPRADSDVIQLSQLYQQFLSRDQDQLQVEKMGDRQLNDLFEKCGDLLVWKDGLVTVSQFAAVMDKRVPEPSNGAKPQSASFRRAREFAREFSKLLAVDFIAEYDIDVPDTGCLRQLPACKKGWLEWLSHDNDAHENDSYSYEKTPVLFDAQIPGRKCNRIHPDFEAENTGFRMVAKQRVTIDDKAPPR